MGFAAAIALLTGLQYPLHRDLGIDQLLLRDGSSLFPGRMSPLTAACFTVLGLAVFLACAGKGRRLVLGVSAAAVVMSVLMIFNYVFGAAAPSFFRGSVLMAVNTAAAMTILGIGVIGLLGRTSPLEMLVGPSATAMLLRRLLVVSITVPVLVGWLRLEGERLGLYDAATGRR